jgi:hypothetical protein
VRETPRFFPREGRQAGDPARERERGWQDQKEGTPAFPRDRRVAGDPVQERERERGNEKIFIH